jgi:hypothetical protein
MWPLPVKIVTKLSDTIVSTADDPGFSNFGNYGSYGNFGNVRPAWLTILVWQSRLSLLK